jgi:ADP-heptose:LPS heptosyltransferase
MAAPRKILVVALDNLGDAVMASTVLAPLKTAFPSAFVGMWAKRYAAGLFDGHPHLDRVHAADPFWDASPGVPPGRLGDFVSTLGAIRAERYDVAVLLNTEWRRALAARLAGIRRRVGFDRRHSRRLLTTAVATPALVQHFVDDHRLLLETGLNVQVPMAAYVSELFLTDAEDAQARRWLESQSSAPQRYWVAHLFSGDLRKNWPLEKWLALIARARDQWPQRACVVVLGPAEDRQLPQRDLDVLKSRAALLQAPSLGLLKGILRHAAAVVDGDSGPGHVAAALRTPTISLFGPTNPLRSRPMGLGPTRIVSARAVADIAVETVWTALADFKPHV